MAGVEGETDREIDRERHRERDRERKRGTDRQTDRQIEIRQYICKTSNHCFTFHLITINFTVTRFLFILTGST